MTTYTFNRGVKLRTSATRRYLVVSIMDGRARVECSTDDEDAAMRLLRQTRANSCPPPRCTIELIDQAEAVARERRSLR